MKSKENTNGSIMCLGIFDGFHIAHMKIINKTLLLSKKFNLTSVFFSFNLPDKFKNDYSIYQSQLKENIVKEFNFNIYYNFDLTNKNNLNMNKLDFLNFLIEKFNVKKIIIGEDFKFGKNREGNVSDLINFFGKNNIFVIKLMLVQKNIKLSSSYIIKLLQINNFKIANKYLPFKYHCIGKVIKGQKYARKLGYPTANLNLYNHKLIIDSGTYAGKTKYNNKFYNSMIYYNKDSNKLETHLLNENLNIYNENIEIYFLKFIELNEKLTNESETLNKLKKCYNKTIDFFKS